MDSIDPVTFAQSINFHGQTLHKMCENVPKLQEPLAKANKDINFKESAARQKALNFQDRGKRLRLHDFISKHASTLFDAKFVFDADKAKFPGKIDESFYSVPPLFEAYCQADHESKIRRFYENLRVGDTVICSVTTKQSVYGVKVLLTEGPNPYVVGNLGIKTVLHVHQVVGNKALSMGDNIRATVVEVVPDADKLILGDAVPITDPMPAIYKKVMVDAMGDSYDTLLQNYPEFNNPGCTSYLCQVLKIGTENPSHLPSLRASFPPDEMAAELRQQQAAKWAFKSVAEGIEHFKNGLHSEAFQSLNRALAIDPRNLEGLVARGALYANSANFQKAIEDFEVALKINPNHPNTRKYMGETLIALGRCHEEKNEITEAVAAYEKCLDLLPYHEDALNSIEFLRSKNLIPAKNSGSEKKSSKKDKKKKGKKKRRASSSGSSSSSSSSSSESSSDSSSDSSSSDSSSSHRKKKKRKNKKEKREKSLSPISKRMLLDQSADVSNAQRNQCNPASFENDNDNENDNDRDYEMRVRAFLEQTKGDSEYEGKVRKFLAEASRFKSDPKSSDDKEKKKKKKDKKDRKEKNKKRKKDDKDDKRKRKKAKKEKTFADDDEAEEARLREQLRNELSMKQELRRRVAEHDALEAESQLKAPPRHDLYEAEVRKNAELYKSPTGGKSAQLGPVERYLAKKDKNPWDSHKPKSPPPLPQMPEPIKTVVDKFSFRVKVLDPTEPKQPQPQPQPHKPTERQQSTGSSGSPRRKRSGSPRSRSYDSRSRSGSQSRSRSRSRSSYERRSRSRSRSPRRYMQRYRGGQRGTYYKPRFQNNMQYRPRGREGYVRGRGQYYNRYDRYDRGRNRGYVPRMRGSRRGVQYYPRNGNQYYDRRRHDDDRHSRERDRGRTRSLSYDEDTIRKASGGKERMERRVEPNDKVENRDPRRRPDEPLSEGEAPDSPPPGTNDEQDKADLMT